MGTPVKEWMKKHDEISIYFDLLDETLLHYGPKINLSDLTIRQIGNKATLIQGELALDLSESQLTNLKSDFPGKRLVPLAMENFHNGLSFYREILTPHKITLSETMTLPFPRIVLVITISHDDPNYTDLVEDIKTMWNRHGAMIGRVELSFSMRSVKCAFKASVDTKIAVSELRKLVSANQSSMEDGVYHTSKVIADQFSNWVTDYIPAEFQTGQLQNAVAHTLLERLFATLFRKSSPLVLYDDGSRLDGYEVADSNTLVPKIDWTFNVSRDTLESLSISLNSVVPVKHLVRRLNEY